MLPDIVETSLDLEWPQVNLLCQEGHKYAPQQNLSTGRLCQDSAPLKKRVKMEVTKAVKLWGLKKSNLSSVQGKCPKK